MIINRHCNLIDLKTPNERKPGQAAVADQGISTQAWAPDQLRGQVVDQSHAARVKYPEAAPIRSETDERDHCSRL